MRNIVRAVIVLTAACFPLPSARAATSSAAGELQAYMRKLGFSESDIADVEKGKVASRVVPEPDDIEASVFAVARIKAREDALVEGIRTIERFRTGEPILQIGRFSKEPRVQDLEPLTLDAEELDDFSKCRVGECELQAPADAIALSKQVDWKAPSARADATRLIKEAMLAKVKVYLEQGSSAMVLYNNNEAPVSVKVELEKMLHNSPNLARYNPEFLNYLLEFPKATLPDVEEFVYWSKDKIRRPVVSVVHAVIQRVNRDGEAGYFIALKHIYDSHYFFANAEFLTAVPTANGDGFYLIDAIRARIDPPHKLRGLLLGKIKGAMKDALTAQVLGAKQRLETGR
jgi:hypothetical protein